MLIAINVRAIIAIVDNRLYISSYIILGPQNYNKQEQLEKICCRDKIKDANDSI
jgi:hypothetical protein